ncbi:class I SAM-dependent methyltransferase [Amycolatopsis dongchuanensis]|uniref:Methyltransferase domain-containing protein n=1 Tax=Amycolatopsis dongchuanensis TaxID=1070866 RepID=A0ABP8VCS0_9PSEU
MGAHTHDHIDWAARIPDLRRGDELHAAAFAEIARRLTANLPQGATVVDAGSGTGGMSAALAAELAVRGGGTLILVDAVPELLAVATETAAAAVEAVGGQPSVIATTATHRVSAHPAHVHWPSQAQAVRAETASSATGHTAPAHADTAHGSERAAGARSEAADTALSGGGPERAAARAQSETAATAPLGGPERPAAGAQPGTATTNAEPSGGSERAAGAQSGTAAATDTAPPGGPERPAAGAQPGTATTDAPHTGEAGSPAGAAQPETLTDPSRGVGPVRIEAVRADVAGRALGEIVPPADLVWAAAMVHHLPDQQAGISALASALAPGGLLTVAEGGLQTQTLPWDVGVGAPGLERRLLAIGDEWFGEMRSGMDGSVRMPYGWTTALTRAGLRSVGSFTALVDHPAPTTDLVRRFVLGHLTRLAETVDDRMSEDDRNAVRLLLDPEGPDYLGNRDDLYVLGTRTVHIGRK